MKPLLFDYLDWTPIEGKRNETDLRLFALPTCGFCKRAKIWLKRKGFSYKLISMDTQDRNLRKQAKAEFQEAFGFPLTYPTLVIDGIDTLVGFIEIDWKQTLKAD